MPRIKRSVLAPNNVSVTLHCYSRCVRKAFLCRDANPETSNRKQWMEHRLQFLASIFGIDLLGYAVMDNHFHLMCRTRPDIVSRWSDVEVARRWFLLFPGRRHQQKQVVVRDSDLLDSLGQTDRERKARAKQLRERLQSVSWLMKCICEYIAKRANREDGVTGAFWDGRFRAQKLLDEQAILACAVYIDLNPIRAAVASLPETSRFTSVFQRIERFVGTTREKKKSTNDPLKTPAYLAPIELTTNNRKSRPADKSRYNEKTVSTPAQHRTGFLRMTLRKYLEVVEWSGKRISVGKRGQISSTAPPILSRLQMTEETWLDCCTNFRRKFGWAVGSQRSLMAEVQRTGQNYIRSKPLSFA